MDNKKIVHTGHSSNVFFKVFSFLLLIACLLGTLYYIRARKYYTLTSDEASEMVLGHLLSEEGSIISKNWYYSTELRVLNTNLFYSFFFRFFDSWHRVRILSIGSMFLFLLLVYYGMCRVYKMQKYIALSAAVLFIPFSDQYFRYMLRGAFYLPHITITFIMLILSEMYMKSSGRKGIILLLCSFIFSVLAGLGGARQLLIFYIPLLAASFVSFYVEHIHDDSKKWIRFSIISFVGSVFGFLINNMLHNEYHFYSYGEESFGILDFTRVSRLINGILETYGYSTGKIFSTSLLTNGICLSWILLTFYAVFYALRNNQRVSKEYIRFSIFTAAAFIVFFLYYMFTKSGYSSRYSLVIIVLSFPVIALFFEQVNWKRIISDFVFLLLILLTAFSGLIYFRNSWHEDLNEELRKISSFLPSEGYFNGYSNIWLANVITELSNGQLDVWCINGHNRITGYYKVHDIDQTTSWLQAVRHDTEHPSGKVFLLFDSDEAQYNNWIDHLYKKNIIYQSSDYVIYGYDDYESMIDTLYPGYDFVFDDTLWMENGKDIDGSRELYVGGVTHGPYKTFWPGTYEVFAKGKGLTDAEMFCIAGYGAQHFELTLIERDDRIMRYRFVLPEKTEIVETIVRNMSDEPDSVVRLDDLSIRKITKR